MYYVMAFFHTSPITTLFYLLLKVIVFKVNSNIFAAYKFHLKYECQCQRCEGHLSLAVFVLVIFHMTSFVLQFCCSSACNYQKRKILHKYCVKVLTASAEQLFCKIAFDGCFGFFVKYSMTPLFFSHCG